MRVYRELVKDNEGIAQANFWVSNVPEKRPGLKTQDLATVDYRQEIVCGCFAGQKPGGGYGLSLAKFEVDDKTVRLELQENMPQPGCLVSKALTYPRLVLAIKRSALPKGRLTVEFILDGVVVQRCDFSN